MARAGRFVAGLVLAGILSGGAYLAWVSTAGSPHPVDLLPAGALGVAEARGVEDVARRLSGTRFAATFAQGPTRAWLERTEVMVAFDAVLSDIKRISGFSVGRDAAFDLLGADTAVGWYPPAADGATTQPWVAGGRLSLRAWAAATVFRLGARLGLGSGLVTHEELAGSVLYTFPGAGQPLHVFLAGRVLVAGSDRPLVAMAARAAGGTGATVSREPSLQAIRGALPARGDVFVWLRDRIALTGGLPEGRAGHGSVGALLRAGETIEIDIAAEAASPPAKPAIAAPQPLPGIALLNRKPLFFLASREPVPAALTDLLQNRRSAVAKRSAGASTAAPIQPTSGYAVVITESAGDAGFFPAPRGLVLIGMASAAEAARALALLYPPGARAAAAGGTQALATRESFPLAGEFELWGAAIGPHLVFATDTSLIDAAAADAGHDTAHAGNGPSWAVSALATISMDKALPLVQRWSAPLSGLLAARWPQGPDIARDLGLLAAIGTVRVAAGSEEHLDRAAITLTVHDLAAR